MHSDDPDVLAGAEFVAAAKQVMHALVSYLVKQAHASKLGLNEYLVLIWACDEGGVTARDVAHALDLLTSTMTGVSDRLERDKLVRRHAHATDRRLVVLKATTRGQAVIARTWGRFLDDLGQLESSLDPEQREMLIAITRQISDRLREDL